MKKLWECIWPPLVFWGVTLALFLAVGPKVGAAPVDAVFRMPSHGASGTFVYSGGGRALGITCAHAFEGKDRTKPIVLDVPWPNPGQKAHVGVRILKVDYNTDLALIEVGCEVPYTCQIALPGQRPQRLLSIGYDGMTWPSVKATSQIVGYEQNRSMTNENPRPGRSGGGLIDPDQGLLFGTCTGYEVGGQRRGIYSSHQAVLVFVGWNDLPAAPQAPRAPYVTEERYTPRPGAPYVTEHYGETPPLIVGGIPPGRRQAPRRLGRNCPNGQCPNGVCPLPN